MNAWLIQRRWKTWPGPFHARWAMAAIEPQLLLFAEGAMVEEEIQELVAPTAGEDLYSDYASLGTTLGLHPLTLL